MYWQVGFQVIVTQGHIQKVRFRNHFVIHDLDYKFEILTLLTSIVHLSLPRHHLIYRQADQVSDTWFSSAVYLQYVNGNLSPCG